MKKTKMVLASLCAGALLFSAASSFATQGTPNYKEEKNTEQKEYNIGLLDSISTYKKKTERIVDYIKNTDKYSSLSIHQMNYGQYHIMLDYDTKTEGLVIAVWDKGGILLFDKPEFVMYDKQNNEYGKLDEIHKKNKDGTDYVLIDSKNLTDAEIHKFEGVYKEIIAKFYSENKEKMEMLENLPKQNQQMEELLDIIKKK